MKLTKVRYVDGMEGRFGTPRDKEQTDNQDREAVFEGSAQAANATVLSGYGDLNFDDPRAKDYVFLTSDRIHVFTFPLPAGSKAKTKQQLKARGNSTARTIDSLIQADRITYDSFTELMYAYGEDGKEVALTNQQSPGQPYSTTRGKTLRYNKQADPGERLRRPAIDCLHRPQLGSPTQALLPRRGWFGQAVRAPQTGPPAVHENTAQRDRTQGLQRLVIAED